MTHSPVRHDYRTGFRRYDWHTDRVHISPQVLRLNETFPPHPLRPAGPPLRRATPRELVAQFVLSIGLPVVGLLMLALSALAVITIARGLVWLARQLSGGF